MFNKILVPVDFSQSTEAAVKKAIDLLDNTNARICLLHVLKSKKTAAAKFLIWEVNQRLAQWKTTIEEALPSANVDLQIAFGPIQDMIIETARTFKPDLIIIGKKNKTRRWPFFHLLSPDRIARISNCRVLTVKPGSIHRRTRIIVLPVRNFVPERKLALAILIAQKFRAQVHVLSIQDNSAGNDRDQSQPFLVTYHHLREKLHHPVEYASVSSHNTAKAALDYAESIMADMILVNPDTESGILTLTGSRHISDMIGKDSRLQILDVQPY